MFVGREQEMKKLEKMYRSNKFEFAVIYGRRRVGKTTLIREFCKGKNAVYFMSREASEERNLENFSRDVFVAKSEGIEGNAVFTDWEGAFDYIGKISENERMILVIDEYPYLAGSNRSISSVLQGHIDLKFKEGKLFLILCGSSMSFMEYQVLGYKSPLYGRRTAQFKIKPFTYYESARFLNAYTNEEKAILFGATGGIPEYLSRVDTRSSVRENIEDLYLSESGHLYEEPVNLLKQELREPSTYNGIIEAIANGASRLNEISTRNSIESNKCSKYINALISLGIVKKEKPLNESGSRKTIYLIEDQMFRFWYKFIPKNMSSIATGLSSSVYDKFVAPMLNEYMGITFELISMQYLMKKNAELDLPFLFGQIGRWWGNNPVKKRQEEIDIIAADDNNAIFCECKWRNELVGMKIFNELVEKSELIKKYEKKYYCLFSKSGFTKELIDRAEELNVELIDLEKIFSVDY